MSNTFAMKLKSSIERAESSVILATMILSAVVVGGFNQSTGAQSLSPRDMLSRLAAQSGSDAASVAFRTGRDYISEDQWQKAEQKFTEYISAYSNEKNVDAALYWIAYSQYKLRKLTECRSTLNRLMSAHPTSAWIGDAKTILAMASSANAVQPKEDDSDELKIVALQALFQADAQRGIPVATDWLKTGSTASVRLKGAALSLLARYGGKQAMPIILNVAANEPDIKLRTRAIAALGSSDDESVVDTLRNLALNSPDNDIVEAALYAIGQNPNPRAITVLGEIATSAKSTSIRRVAISSISQRTGEPAVDQLLRLYEADQSLEIRKAVIYGLANRRSERAGAKLLEIARASDNLELRKAAISGIARRSGEQGIEMLLSLYDTEKNEDLKDYIINSLAYSNDKRIMRKLIEIAKNPQAPIERRKRAIGWLSRSKDPEVIKFLEDLLK